MLKPGMTFHIIPWMWGVDGDKTCGISDTIHITEDGCESFFSMDRDFVVKADQGKQKLISLDKGNKNESKADKQPQHAQKSAS